VLYVPNGLLGTIRMRVGGTVAGQAAACIERWADGNADADATANADGAATASVDVDAEGRDD